MQMISLIVSELPTRADAEAALADAQREAAAAAAHPESREARAARAAGIDIFPAGFGREDGDASACRPISLLAC